MKIELPQKIRMYATKSTTDGLIVFPFAKRSIFQDCVNSQVDNHLLHYKLSRALWRDHHELFDLLRFYVKTSAFEEYFPKKDMK